MIKWQRRINDLFVVHFIGIEYYEKNVVNQLLEFTHYYSTEVLTEAKIFKEYAGNKNTIDVNDVRLAITSKSYNTFTRPLPITYMKKIAQEKNNIALPKIDEHHPT
jgi:transcription initiation factor TFIID subunit 9B